MLTSRSYARSALASSRSRPSKDRFTCHVREWILGRTVFLHRRHLGGKNVVHALAMRRLSGRSLDVERGGAIFKRCGASRAASSSSLLLPPSPSSPWRSASRARRATPRATARAAVVSTGRVEAAARAARTPRPAARRKTPATRRHVFATSAASIDPIPQDLVSGGAGRA